MPSTTQKHGESNSADETCDMATRYLPATANVLDFEPECWRVPMSLAASLGESLGQAH